jgi:hypothetical protein
MRIAAIALLLAACGGSAPEMMQPMTTGLVVTLDYDSHEIVSLSVRGKAANGRSFGPYKLDEHNAPPGSTVGLVFDAGDAGPAQICGEARDDHGDLQLSNCDSFTVRANAVSDVTLSLNH